MSERNITVEDVNFFLTSQRGVEELVLHLDGDDGRIALPLALVADRTDDMRIIELRMYFSTWPLTGAHANRPPVLQPVSDLREPDVVGDYQRALAAGDVEAVLAAFEPDASVCEPAGDAYIHRGTDDLRALYELFFSNGGGIALEHCAVTDDGRSCALEYNAVAWGQTELPPEAGMAVYVRGDSGKLATARITTTSTRPCAGACRATTPHARPRDRSRLSHPRVLGVARGGSACARGRAGQGRAQPGPRHPRSDRHLARSGDRSGERRNLGGAIATDAGSRAGLRGHRDVVGTRHAGLGGSGARRRISTTVEVDPDQAVVTPVPTGGSGTPPTPVCC